jgi:hypothetical protein
MAAVSRSNSMAFRARSNVVETYVLEVNHPNLPVGTEHVPAPSTKELTIESVENDDWLMQVP